jgi:hypothetical protein
VVHLLEENQREGVVAQACSASPREATAAGASPAADLARPLRSHPPAMGDKAEYLLLCPTEMASA